MYFHHRTWGDPFFNNAGCEVELSGTCTGQHQADTPITGGFWDDIFEGPYGRFAGGLQYSFTQKYGFAGLGFSPKQNENMFFTSLRYYPF